MHIQSLEPQELTKEQSSLIGKGCAGPPVALDSNTLTDTQVSLLLLNTQAMFTVDSICSQFS